MDLGLKGRVALVAASSCGLGRACAVAFAREGADVAIGAPYVTGARVTATVQAHGKADKVGITKFRRRKHYLRQKGHRQPYTEVKVTGITAA